MKKTKILVEASQKSNLYEAILYYMEREKIDYVTYLMDYDFNEVSTILYIQDTDSINKTIFQKKKPVLFISEKKEIIERKEQINYIITNLVTDTIVYTDVQKEYLFKKGIYHIFLEKLGELLINKEGYNGMIYDLTEIKSLPENWVFHFDSINETYAWLNKKNKSLPNDFVRKVVNFYADKVYDDSLKEIDYLTEKLMEIKEKKRVVDLFICTKDELELFRKNYFFKLLLKNISSTYHFYYIDKDTLKEKEPVILESLLDGILLYPDCVYRDTYGDEISLGYVDCREDTIFLYNQYIDYVITHYGIKIHKEDDLDVV